MELPAALHGYTRQASALAALGLVSDGLLGGRGLAVTAAPSGQLQVPAWERSYSAETSSRVTTNAPHVGLHIR